MSVELLGQVWRLDLRPHGRKMVLLAFADAANTDGVTWIALQSERGKQDILSKCSMGIRAVQDHVQALELSGHLERIEERGKGCLWIVRATPANSAGLFGFTPAEKSETPANSAGEPFLTIKEEEKPLRLDPPVDKCPVCGFPLPPGLSLAQWEAFLDMRFSLGKQVRAYVAGILLSKLSEIGKRWDPGQVVDRSTVNGWPDLYEPEEGRVTGVRRVKQGALLEPVGGMSAEDRAELRRIHAIDDFGEMMRAKKAFYDRMDARNGPSAAGVLIGELPLIAAMRKRKRKKGSA